VRSRRRHVGVDFVSKSNEMIRMASQKGYIVNKLGEIINPKGKVVKGSIGKFKNSTYKTFGISHKGISRPILVHRFVAYKKFGETALEAECIRHLNHNSLDNRPDNIAIGTYREIYETKVRGIS
jgi:hypothetical protein